MTNDTEEIIEDISYSKIPKAQKVEKISKYLNDLDPEVVCTACFELGRLKARDAISQIALLLTSDNGKVTNMAICSLTDMIDSRDVDLLPGLYRNLKNSDYMTVLSSIEALGKIQSKESIPYLTEMLKTEKTGLQARVITSLGETGCKETLPILNSYLEEVLKMDYGVEDRGGMRGCDLHPVALEIITKEAIEAVDSRGAKASSLKNQSKIVTRKIYELVEPFHTSKKNNTKFGGNPDWLEEPQWPISADSTEQMRLICQISLDEEFPNFAGCMAYILMTEDKEEYTEGTWELEGGENAVIIQPQGIPLVPVKAIPTGPTREEYYVREKVVEIEKDSLEGVRIGGVPVFLQAEESPSPETEWSFLIQIDSVSMPFEINFGDAGVGYAFINITGNSGKFLWQCH